jgi:hypothetical protein
MGEAAARKCRKIEICAVSPAVGIENALTSSSQGTVAKPWLRFGQGFGAACSISWICRRLS